MKPGEYKETGFKHLDRVIDSCSRHGIYSVIDLHAAPGGMCRMMSFADQQGKTTTGIVMRAIIKPTVGRSGSLSLMDSLGPSRLSRSHRESVEAYRTSESDKFA